MGETAIHIDNLHVRYKELSAYSVKRMLLKLGEEAFDELVLVKRADNLAQHPDYRGRQQELDELERVKAEVISQSQCFSLRDLALNGRDLMAMGVIRTLRDHGIRVPEDVSVVGFDGIPLGEFFLPRLSSVEQPAVDMARRSVELLLDTIENDAPARHEAVPFTLLYRESTGKAKV